MTKLDYERVREHIKNSSQESIIMIGCDSVRFRKNGIWYAKYSTAVCVRKAEGVGKDIIYRGSKLFGASEVLRDYGVVESSGKIRNLRMRLMQEVTFALDAFENLYESIGDRVFEIHLDINSRPECASYGVLQEAKGYVMGMTGGYEPEFKPYAHAASFAAHAIANNEITL